MAEKTGLLAGGTPQQTTGTASHSAAVYHDSSQTPTQRFLQVAFLITVIIMVLVTLILSIVRGVQVSSAMYFMMGLSLLGFVAIDVILILLIRKDELPKEKTWFLYFVGACAILEAIFTDVLLYAD